jgi:hypothetical protein
LPIVSKWPGVTAGRNTGRATLGIFILEPRAIYVRIAAQRQLAGERHRGDAGNLAHRVKSLLEEPVADAHQW